jgi:RES domain-containing protein
MPEPKVLKIKRGGRHYRVCDPTWADACDATKAQPYGGRWNAPGSFPVLYLNANVATARANALRRYEGEAFGLFDLNPSERPHLQIVTIARCWAADAITTAGLRSLGLTDAYPKGVTWKACQKIGQRVYDAKLAGVACRSAALEGGEELALFELRALKTRHQRLRFEEWFTNNDID